MHITRAFLNSHPVLRFSSDVEAEDQKKADNPKRRQRVASIRLETAKENYNKSRRKHRGLFKSNNDILINADVNGAFQILKKVFPIKWNRGCELHPKVLALV